MTQKENQSFLDFANDIQNKNSLLLGIESHLPEAQNHNRIEVGMDCTLSTRATPLSLIEHHVMYSHEVWRSA